MSHEIIETEFKNLDRSRKPYRIPGRMGVTGPFCQTSAIRAASSGHRTIPFTYPRTITIIERLSGQFTAFTAPS
jgi:hypothetical protein